MKTNSVEVEFSYSDGTGGKKFITIPHGQFQPYPVICDAKRQQFFIWSMSRGKYEEVKGELLSNVEVSNAES